MRRENYELCVSRPTVIMKRDEGDRLTEPYETIYVEVPDEHANGVMKLLHARKGQMEDMISKEGTGHTFIQAYIPTRGIIGFEFELVNLTSGHGIFSHLFRDYGPYAGDITTRTTGTLVSMNGRFHAVRAGGAGRTRTSVRRAAGRYLRGRSLVKTRARWICRSIRARKST